MESITTYNHTGKCIIINGNEIVFAPAKIILCLVIDNIIILLLDQNELKSDSNIYSYDIQGKLLWIVEPPILHERNYFTSIYVLKDLNFYGYCINGLETKIDLETGKILYSELIK